MTLVWNPLDSTLFERLFEICGLKECFPFFYFLSRPCRVLLECELGSLLGVSGVFRDGMCH